MSPVYKALGAIQIIRYIQGEGGRILKYTLKIRSIDDPKPFKKSTRLLFLTIRTCHNITKGGHKICQDSVTYFLSGPLVIESSI